MSASDKIALITGITGQDGSYLADLLLGKGYTVHGVVRRTSSLDRSRLGHLYADAAIYGKRLFLHYADLDDPTPLRRLLAKIAPDEIYHLAGQSHVGLSFEIAESTCDLTAMGTLRLLEMIRDLPKAPRLFHASSSELFGKPLVAPQTEETPWVPVSPYGAAKAFATRMVTIYRATYGLHACNGILFNHESPRRGENFVTRKICRAAASIKLGLQNKLSLGNLDALRDWGYAPDYVRGMWLTLQQPEADDYVFATGELHSVRDLAAQAFTTVGLDWEAYVEVNPAFFRPAEATNLVGDPTRARTRLGWAPSRPFGEIIAEMTRAEYDALAKAA